MTQVALENVNKIYGGSQADVHAVIDLTMTVQDGEFVALLGPSGCGKSSTLRMIVGLEDISAGTIRFDGQVVNELTPEQRNVAMAFESYALYPNFTVGENLGFPLEVRGLKPAERAAEVRRIAQLLRIEKLLDQKPHQLSGGQQQRVSLGRALVRDPAAFILDEVMSHLDSHLKFQMLFELKRLHQSIQKTMVYVTHDQTEALALADRVAVMHNGRLQQFASRDELYARPANRFVADFIGEPPTNFFDVDIVEQDGVIQLAVRGTDICLQPDDERGQALRRTGTKSAVVGVRPQNLFLHADTDSRAFAATVAINEYLGERTILTLQQNGVSCQALAAPDVDAPAGSGVKLFYRPADIMVFDKKTELLIH